MNNGETWNIVWCRGSRCFCLESAFSEK